MKKIQSILFPLLILALILNGCKKSSGGADSQAPSNTAVGTFGSINFASTATSAPTGTDNGTNFQLIFLQKISAIESSFITLDFPDTVKVNGVYPVDGTLISFSYLHNSFNPGIQQYYSKGNDSATLTITSINMSAHTIAGTFAKTEIYNSDEATDSMLVKTCKFNSIFISN